MADETLLIIGKFETDQIESAAKALGVDFRKLGDEGKKSADKTEREWRETTRTIEKSEVSVRKLRGTIAGIASALAVREIQRGLFDFGESAVAAARDAREMRSAFEFVFGDLTEQSREFAETLSSEVGRSLIDIEQGLLDFKIVFDGLGFSEAEAAELSQQLASIAIDLGSLQNVAPQEAFERLRAGLVGSTEAMRSLGISVNETLLRQIAYDEGITETNRQLGLQERALATVAAIFEQGDKAIGNARDTSGEFANRLVALEGRLRDVRVEIGDQLIEKIEDLVEQFGGWDQVTVALTGSMKILGETAATALEGVVEFAPNVAELIEQFGIAVELLAKSQRLITALPGLPGGDKLRSQLSEQQEALEGIGRALQGVGAALRSIEAPSNVISEGDLLDSLREFDLAINGLTESDLSPFEDFVFDVNEFNEAISGAANEAESAELSVSALSGAVDELNATVGSVPSEAPGFWAGFSESIREINAELENTNEVGKQVGGLFFGDLTRSFRSFFSDTASGARKLGDAWSDLGDRLKLAVIDMIAQILALRAAQATLGFFGFGGGAGGTFESGFNPSTQQGPPLPPSFGGLPATAGLPSTAGLAASSGTGSGSVLSPSVQLAALGTADSGGRLGSFGGGAAASIGGSNINMQVSITAVDSASFLSLAARDPAAIARVVIQAAENDPGIRRQLGLTGTVA